MAIEANYELLDQIGEGGMAVVHRARQRGIAGFDRVVAVKRIQPHLVGRAEFDERFVREARIVSALAHANIVQIYDFGGDYIAMEYLEGWSLLRIIATAVGAGHRVPLPVILSVLHDLCDALDHVHTRRGLDGAPLGIVHRDLSLGNLFITRSGHLKLIDFGIATAPGLASDDGRICGKPSYMAPEVVRGRASDARADVFAVGVIAWELLTSRRPFLGADDAATMDAVLRTRVVSPQEHRPDCPPMLASLVLAALAKDPDKRTQSAAIVRDQIEIVMRACDVDARSSVVTRWLADSGLLLALAEREPNQAELPTVAERPRAITPIASIVEPRRLGVLWWHAIAIAAAIVIAPFVVAAQASRQRSATKADEGVTITPIAVVAPVAPAARRIEEPAKIEREVAPPPRARPAHTSRPRARVEVAVRTDEPRSITAASPVAQLATEAPVPAPVAPVVVAPGTRGPATIPPDRVRWISGEIGRVDRVRLERDGGTAQLSAVLCIDERGAVSSVRLLADEPGWLRAILDHDLRRFRFTPYPGGAACFVRRVAIAH